ncbi:MAG: dehydrogenase E1 component subunit alpha/beta [Bdellovibrionales bacterium]|nr:dehydrogenase E1 component subunit alpha/beta [Bdellovibrionales bacterium]
MARAQTTTTKRTIKRNASPSLNGSHRNGSSPLKKRVAKKTTKKTVKKKSSAKTTPKKKAPAKRKVANKKTTAKKVGSNKKKSPAKRATSRKPSTLTSKDLVSAYRDMVRARLNDEKAIVLYKQNKCHFQIGTAGHEAIQIATSRVFRPGKDWFYPYYRDMALCAGLGMTDGELMMNAMNKQGDPNSHGRQMPMHYGHKELNIVNQSSPTGTQYLQAVGCAMASHKLKKNEVTYVSSGEGTCSQGDFHEALNWAAREKLPVVFVIQNNNYAISVPISEQIAGESVYKIVAGYENLERFEVDGTDFQESYKAVSTAHARALAGEGPSVVVANVPRLQSHSISDNHLKYRAEKDIAAEQKRCPLAKMERFLITKKYASKSELAALREEVKGEIDKAAEWAEEQSDPNPAQALDHTINEPNPASLVTEGQATGEEIYLVDALNHALHEEMARNDQMYVFGQDIAHGKGGVFTVTSGLTDKFSAKRAFNAPLAEASIAGVAIGMATRGLTPVAEIQFGDYVWTAMMQIRNELAMMNYRSGGDFTCPAVLRIPVGGYIHGACYHSQNIEGTFSHFPGLHIVLPSNATDAKGLLKSAIRLNDPVLFLEHKGLYRQVYAKGPEGDADFLVPIGKAKVVREGSDLTIVTYGAIVQKSILAAQELEKEGASVEVIDLRTIVPLDTNTIFESAKKTGRVLVAHEDVQFMGFGAEIAAQLADSCFEHLDAPIRRIGMKYAAAVPHSGILEAAVLPQNDDVLVAARNLLSY